MLLRVDLYRVRAHGDDLDLAAELGNEHLDFLAAAHERVELDLRVADVVLENAQLLAQVDALLDRLRHVGPHDELLDVAQVLRLRRQIVVGVHCQLRLSLDRLLWRFAGTFILSNHGLSLDALVEEVLSDLLVFLFDTLRLVRHHVWHVHILRRSESVSLQSPVLASCAD